MKTRERVLLLIVGGLVGLFVAGFGVKGLFLKPLREIDQRTALLRERFEKVKAERRAFFEAEDQMKSTTLRTFADTVDEASARSGEMLTRLLSQSGLEESEFTRLPVGPRKIRGAQEIGWSVQGDGPLSDVIDLVFLLETSPYLHRVENLTVSTGETPGTVRVRLRYLTLVLDSPGDVRRTNLVSRLTLDGPERKLYNGIVERDILRPYIKRPPSPPAPKTPPAGTDPTPGPENLRIVSLSEWNGQPEVHVLDLSRQKTARYRTGDSLAGGALVCVDYRPRPMPGDPTRRSDSRAILRIGTNFFSVERGRTLADLRPVAPDQLPPGVGAAKSK